MKRFAFSLIAAAALSGAIAASAPPGGRTDDVGSPQAVLESRAPARSAREVRGATPYAEIENEPPPRLIVDDPLPDLLDKGVVWIQYRTENVRIVPVFGKGARGVSPRVGHLHVRVDDLPWWWADPSDTNTIDLAGMPPGEHKVRIDLVDPDHQVFPGQSRTVKFTVPGAPHAAPADAAAAIGEGKLPAGYRDWRLISVAREEGELDDIRAVLGNDAAINAYREGKAAYPDGTVIARLAWSFDTSEENNQSFGRRQSFVAGHPKNGVQFMVKDAKKYAPTGGWKYAQFDDGKPLADAAQLRSCFECHRAVTNRDYVFTRYAQ